MNALALLAGMLAMWVFMLVVGVGIWAFLNYAAESAERYVADEWERKNVEGRR